MMATRCDAEVASGLHTIVRRSSQYHHRWCTLMHPTFDGIRAIARTGSSTAIVHSRAGHDISTSLPETREVATLLHGRSAVLDREFVTLDPATAAPVSPGCNGVCTSRVPPPMLLASVRCTTR
ncbi:hypothetical protein ABT369_54180 [Dactylosporangium sp. NPDC000244]|uniref:hypothetical protein n=1 Tax=Dactylosporangium sp. NPDC000244 TaxID=3154365 RepID=UPI00331D7ADA